MATGNGDTPDAAALFEAANKLRGSVESAEYKHLVLGLNANYAWIQHFLHHLAPDGRAGFVMANGSLTSNQSGEGRIRESLVRADVVDCVVALPAQLFYTTGIPVCLWFLDRDKASSGERDRRNELLSGQSRSSRCAARDVRERREPTDRQRRPRRSASSGRSSSSVTVSSREAPPGRLRARSMRRGRRGSQRSPRALVLVVRHERRAYSPAA